MDTAVASMILTYTNRFGQRFGQCDTKICGTKVNLCNACHDENILMEVPPKIFQSPFYKFYQSHDTSTQTHRSNAALNLVAPGSSCRTSG